MVETCRYPFDKVLWVASSNNEFIVRGTKISKMLFHYKKFGYELVIAGHLLTIVGEKRRKYWLQTDKIVKLLKEFKRFYFGAKMADILSSKEGQVASWIFRFLQV